MPRTPDRRPGALEEDEEIRLATNAAPPTVAGALNYNGTSFQLKDSAGVFDPRSGGGGITAGQHKTLDQLVHDIAETCYEEITRSGEQVVSSTIWTNNTKTTKVREVLLTRSGGQVDTITVKQYDGAGALAETLVGTVARSSGRVENIEWVAT